MKSNSKKDFSAIRSIDNLNLSTQSMSSLIKTITGKGQNIKFRARGHSMFPCIKDGDIIIISPCKDLLPEVGKIAVVFNPDTKKLTIHRIIKATRKAFITKGDCCFHDDGYQIHYHLIGYVSAVKNRHEKFISLILPKRNQKLFTILSKCNIICICGKIWKVLLSIANNVYKK